MNCRSIEIKNLRIWTCRQFFWTVRKVGESVKTLVVVKDTICTGIYDSSRVTHRIRPESEKLKTTGYLRNCEGVYVKFEQKQKKKKNNKNQSFNKSLIPTRNGFGLKDKKELNIFFKIF